MRSQQEKTRAFRPPSTSSGRSWRTSSSLVEKCVSWSSSHVESHSIRMQLRQIMMRWSES